MDKTHSSGFQSQSDAAVFEQEGIRLWLQLRLELGSDYEVYYFSDELHRLVTDPNQLADSVLQQARPVHLGEASATECKVRKS